MTVTDRKDELTPESLERVSYNDEIVISGIAGRFPDSDDMKHFQENLMNKVNLISDDERRWKKQHLEIPQNTGKVNHIEKFDADYFGYNYKQAHTMDPIARVLLEKTYEAIVDAGVNPKKLRGEKVGVFIGACFSEPERIWFYQKMQVNGLGLSGCNRALLTNRISHWLGVTGPSYSVDTACSSSLYAMEHAYRAIRDGICDAAIVGGANLCLHPYVSLQFFKLGVLSPDGYCKSFDESANGYVRSEAISVVFLQKAKDAKRVYATFIHAKANCDGFKEQGITFPSSALQAELIASFYKDIGMSPTVLSYIEAHATGTKVGDPEEVSALDKVLCTGRKEPLWIGSIKSNLGHAEPASGLCSLAKVIIGMESGLLPPNLHLKKLREGVDALQKGRLRVVTEPTPWNGGYVGVNSFGFGGANAHLLLKSNSKDKINGGQPKDELPRLVAVSGRTEEAVETLLKDIESRPCDAEYVRLLQEIHEDDIEGHLFRGYTILPPRGLVKNRVSEITDYSTEKRPVWFVFSGLGSQWPGMGESLLRLPVFAQAITKCQTVLKPHGIDVVNIITNKDKKIFDNILNSIIGIAAIQIGMVDVLTALGVIPDNIIGHSLGDLGCAYANGSLTAEQVILAAYSRGVAFAEAKVAPASMAIVDLSYGSLKKMCPSDIEIVCRNSANNVTITGPAVSVKNLINELQANRIMAKEIPCINIPFHSRYVAPVAPKLLAFLQKVIPSPKLGSAKWLNSSMPQEKLQSSAEYFTNNLLSEVRFEESLAFIPNNAVIIEISPEQQVQTILLDSLSDTITTVSLSQRGHTNNLEVLLQGLGQLFNAGLQPQLHKLYPEVAWPVSRSTPMISPLIKWSHEDYFVTSFHLQEKLVSGERIVEVSLAEEEFEFVAGHVIDGRILFPATGYLTLIWETISMLKGHIYSSVSVIFEDVKFHRATNVPKEGSIEFNLMIHKGSGKFEVIEGGTPIVTGYVHTIDNPKGSTLDIDMIPVSGEEEVMTKRDVYKELRLRGYNYSGLFRSIKSATTNGSRGNIEWHNNFVAFMDNMLQMQILGYDSRGLFVPTGITKLVVDTEKHLNCIVSMTGEEKVYPVRVSKVLNVIVSGGIEIRGLKASAIARRKPAGEPVLESYKFVPFLDRAEVTLQELAILTSHTAFENQGNIKVKAVELLEDGDQVSVQNLLSPLIADTLADMPLIQPDISVISRDSASLVNVELPAQVVSGDLKKLGKDCAALIGIGHKLLSRRQNLDLLLSSVVEGGFILTREPKSEIKEVHEKIKGKGLTVIMEKTVDKDLFIFMRKRQRIPKKTVIVKVDNEQFNWVEEMKNVMTQELNKGNVNTTRVVYVSQGSFESGLVGFINCLRQEPGGEIARGILIQDPKAPKFSLEDPFYAKELQKDMAVLVLDPKGRWGNYRHLLLPALLPKPVTHGFVNELVRGDLSSLTWLEGPIQKPSNQKNFINVLYSSINFRDVMLATGKLAAEVVFSDRKSQECILGFEYSGVTNEGRRVMGVVETHAMTNYLYGDELLMWDIPDNWSYEEAVTVPCVYGTCYHALYLNGKMKKGDKVLIHAGTGGVGQAAINLALYEGCEVFTTVGTPEKRRFIRENFPQIPESHIGNSRDASFEQMVMRETSGKGVDIVLNSLAEEKLLASVRCLGRGGRFLEIGKFDLAANNRLSLECFQRQISFHGVMLDKLIVGSKEDKICLTNIMNIGLKNKAIKPLVRTVYPKDQLEAAFRFMAAGKHIGKVVIQVADEKKPLNEPVMALPRFHCLADHSYIILGGLGGFGLELADWLVLRGAENLVITSRTGIQNGYQKMRIDLWQSYGTKVVIVSGKDVSKNKDCQSIIETATKLAPVDGIFNLAVILKDAIWNNQTPEMFEESFRSKAWSTRHFDALTRKLCPKLRQFVVFSSVSCGRGNAGQTNYGMSNSVMERICERRAAEGLPGLAVQWGAVGDVGLVADMQEDNKELVIGGTLQQRISSCLQELDGFLCQNSPIVSSMVVAEKKAGSGGSANIVDTVLNIMGLKDLKSVGPQTSLAELGMDSMMAVEIKQTLEREFELFLTAQDIRSLNFAKLQQYMANDTDKNGKSKDNDKSENEVPNVMKLLVRLIGDEKDQTETCVELRTKAEKGRGPIFMIPGIEGAASVFNELATKLTSTAYCLQYCTGNDKNDSIFTIADKLLPHILERNKGRKNFELIGYSFGSMIAIELVRRLESHGLTGKLILIDGSPELMSIISQNLSSSSASVEFQMKLLLGMMNMFSPVIAAELVMELEKQPTWEDKLNVFIARLPAGSVSMSKEYQRIFCTALYYRMTYVQNYDVANLKPLNTPIVLFKPNIPTYHSASKDYGLSKFTKGKLDVHYADGNHTSILDNVKIAMAINGEPIETVKK